MTFGIDNGTTKGAIFGLDGNMPVLQESLPVHEQHGENRIDSRGFLEIVKPYREEVFYVEYFSKGGKNMGANTIGRMENSYATMTTTLDLLGVRWKPVFPKTWQAQFFPPKARGVDDDSYTKREALKAATLLWPNHSFVPTSRHRVAHDGMVDAALIAEWGRRQIEAGKVPEEKKEAFEAEFVRVWNAYAIEGGLPKLQGRIPKTLRPAWGQRITDPEWRKNWEAALAYAITDDFYIGNTKERWKLNPTTFLRPQCVPKLMLRRLAAKEVDDKLQHKEDQGTWL